MTQSPTRWAALLFLAAFCPTLFFAQKVADFEDVETVSEKGFFKSYIKDYWKGFWNVDPKYDANGTANIGLRSYNNLGDGPDRQDPFFYSFSMNMNARAHRLQLPFFITVTAKNRELSYPNPKEFANAFSNKVSAQKDRLVRFGISPRYKWTRLHFGHRNMTFSQFSLSNLTFLGAAAELTPGLLRFSVLGGRFARATPVDESLVVPNVPVFERRGWGTKLGVGTRDEFIDFFYFQAKDNPNSIPDPNITEEILPVEANEAVGFVGQKTLFKKLKLKAEATASAITANALDAPSEEPIFPHLSNEIAGKQTSKFRAATEQQLNWETQKFTVGMKHRWVDPEYKSLGTFFFDTDLQELSGLVSFGLLQNRLRISTSNGLARNNLDKTKPSRNTRYITTNSAEFTKGNFNASLNYSNNTSQIAYLLNLGLDSLNVIVITNDAGAKFSYSKSDKKKNRHVFTVQVNSQVVTDDINDPFTSAASQMVTTNLIYNGTYGKKKWGFTAKTNFNRNALSLSDTRRTGFGVGVNKKFLKNKITSSIDYNYFFNRKIDSDNSDNSTSAFKFAYKISKKKTLTLTFNYLQNRTFITPIKRRGEVVGSLGYKHNFGRAATKAEKPEKQ